MRFSILLQAAALLCAGTSSASAVAVRAAADQDSIPSAPTVEVQPAADQDSLAAAPRDTVRLVPVRMVGSVDPALDTARLVTEHDVAWNDHRYMADLLAQTPGPAVREQSSAGQYSEVTIRGAGWRSVGALRNGLLLNDPASGVYNFADLSVRDAERIEVVSGPRGFLYGINTAGGAVNVVTKNYAQARPFTRVFYSQGPSLFSDFDGLFSQNLTRSLNLLVGLQGTGTDGRFLNSASSLWNARVKVRYEFSPSLNLILSENFTSSQTELNGGIDLGATPPGQEFEPIGAVPVNADTYDKITRHNLDLTVRALLLGDSASVSLLSVYYNNGLREYRDEESATRTNGIQVSHDHRSSWTGIAASQAIVTGFQKLTVGGNLELRQIEGSPTMGRRRNSLAALWAADDLAFGDAFTLGVFGRLDGTGGMTGTGFGADVRLILAPGLTMFGGASRSVRFPTFTELFWTDSTVRRPGPIGKESHLLVEAGVRIDLERAGWLWLAGFYRRVQDPIVTAAFSTGSPFPGVEFTNGPVLDSYGADVRFRFRPWMLTVEGNARLLLQRQGGSDPQSYPAFAGDAGVYFEQVLLDSALGLKAGFRGRTATAHRGMLFNPEILAYVPNGTRDLQTGGSVDFVARAAIGDAIVHFIWENLTDANYYGTPFYPAYGRGIRFGITWDFTD